MAWLLVAKMGTDLTSEKYKGEWLTVGVRTDLISTTTLVIDFLDKARAVP